MNWIQPIAIEEEKPPVEQHVPDKECDHRWRVLICAVDPNAFYRLRERSFCSRCKVEA